MLIKLKDPQELAARNTFLLLCYFSCLVGGILLAFIMTANSWALRAILLLPVFLLILFTIRAFLRWRRLLQRRKQADHVTAIDFQPAGVVLKAPYERFLPYAETDFHLRIYIDIIHAGKRSFPDVTKVSFIFRFNEEETEWDHKTTFRKIFPILDESACFAHFSYDVHLLSSSSRAQDFSAFLKEQIQNHLHYKVHLPFSGKTLAGSWIATIGTLFFFFLLRNEAGALYGIPFLIISILVGWISLLRFYRAKHQLDKYRK